MNERLKYEELIEKAKTRELDSSKFYEKHHIIPKCLGGEDTKENLVNLTSYEHILAHYYLYLWFKEPKLLYAFKLLTFGSRDKRLSDLEKLELESLEQYAQVREEALRQKPERQTREKISRELKGRVQPPELIEKRRQGVIQYYSQESLENRKNRVQHIKEAWVKRKAENWISPMKGKPGRKWTEEQKIKKSEQMKGRPGVFKGKNLSEEHRKKLSEAHKGKIPWNKGKTGIYSEDLLKRRSELLKGKPRSEESKRKGAETFRQKSQVYQYLKKFENYEKTWNEFRKEIKITDPYVQEILQKIKSLEF